MVYVMYVWDNCFLQEQLYYLDSVINPCQLQGYENLYDRCVLESIIHFVTFIYLPNIAATSSPPSPNVPKNDKTSVIWICSSYKLSPAAVFFRSTWIQSCRSPEVKKVEGFGVEMWNFVWQYELYCKVMLGYLLCNYIYSGLLHMVPI